jgi:hypothetical protein
VRFALAIYAIGVVIGLIGTDARPLARVCLALAWPVGVAAFVVTVGGLLAVSTVLFPAFGVVALASALLGWVLMG